MDIYLLTGTASAIFLLIWQHIQHSSYIKKQKHLNEIRNLPQPTVEDLQIGTKFYYFVGGVGNDDYEIMEIKSDDLINWAVNPTYIKLEWSRIKK